MGRLVVDELWAEGAELGEVPLEGLAARVLEVESLLAGSEE